MKKQKTSQVDKSIVIKSLNQKISKSKAIELLTYMYNSGMSCNNPECWNKINGLEYYSAYSRIKQFIENNFTDDK